MQRAIRWAVCLVMAATSIPVFADGNDSTQAQQPDDQVTNTQNGEDTQKPDTSAMDDAGSGGREPARLLQGAAADDAAARLQHDDFVKQSWNSP